MTSCFCVFFNEDVDSLAHRLGLVCLLLSFCTSEGSTLFHDRTLAGRPDTKRIISSYLSSLSRRAATFVIGTCCLLLETHTFFFVTVFTYFECFVEHVLSKSGFSRNHSRRSSSSLCAPPSEVQGCVGF